MFFKIAKTSFIADNALGSNSPKKRNMLLQQVRKPHRSAQRRNECLGRCKDFYGKDTIEEIIFELGFEKWKESWQVAK